MTLEEWAVDPDAQLTAWWEANAEALYSDAVRESRTHRCPSDMPPCPECQERIAQEDWREYGAA